MFDYADPAGRDFLGQDDVRTAYRSTMAGFYDRFASRVNSAFTWVEAFAQLSGGAVSARTDIDWRAFPLTAIATDRQIDRDRFRLQDEYVEWRVETQNARVIRVTFVTQLPEYYEASPPLAQPLSPTPSETLIPAPHPQLRSFSGTTQELRM